MFAGKCLWGSIHTSPRGDRRPRRVRPQNLYVRAENARRLKGFQDCFKSVFPLNRIHKSTNKGYGGGNQMGRDIEGCKRYPAGAYSPEIPRRPLDANYVYDCIRFVYVVYTIPPSPGRGVQVGSSVLCAPCVI